MSRWRLYIDADGVILGEGSLPARHLDLFLDLVLPRFGSYWLTTHKLNVMTYLGQHFH